jgi:hypothetical protein
MRPERIEVGRCVHVREQRFLELDARGVEAVQDGAEAALADLERGQRAPRDRARKRAALRRCRVAAGFGQQPQRVGGEARHVDRDHDGDLVRRRAETGGDRRDRTRPGIGQPAGTDSEPLVAYLPEQPPGAVGKRLSFVLGQLLRRAEAAARAADEQDPRQARIRHGSV